MWLHVWLSVTIGHHSANSGDKGLVKEDIKFSKWHVTSCDHVVRAVRLHYELRLTIRQYPVKFAGHMPSEGRNTLFLVCHVSHVTTWSEEYVTSWVQSLYQRILWLHRWVPFTISSQPAMFGGHGACGTEDIKFSICHRTSNDHVIRGSLWVSFPRNKSSLCQVWWPLVLQKTR